LIFGTALFHRKPLSGAVKNTYGNEKRTYRYHNLTEDHGTGFLVLRPSPSIKNHSTNFRPVGRIKPLGELPTATVNSLRLTRALPGILPSDTTDTVLVAVPALLRTEWWPMISFVVFKSPAVGGTHIFRPGEPMLQILIVPVTSDFTLVPMD
jgi:hypothetical protein